MATATKRATGTAIRNSAAKAAAKKAPTRTARPVSVAAKSSAREPKANAVAQVPGAQPSTAVVPPSSAPSVAVAKKPIAKAGSTTKLKKSDSVRTSFNMAASEYAALATLKKSSSTKELPVKRSQLIRAGMVLLRDLPASRIHAIISALPPLKAPGKKK